ncbi:MAG: hypothetical protein IH597_05955 [Bacteroidales bacterium]|nr:hypothetical protein [Bacteroidales bacterium]
MLNIKMDQTQQLPSGKRNARSIHIFTETFSEGEWHSFKVLKLMQIPGENVYYLLESLQGNRILMTAKYYDGYGIIPGTTIKCLVDKINCSGKIYLEPAHPYYEAGNRYLFHVIGSEQFTDRKGRSITRFIAVGPSQEESIATIDTRQAAQAGALISAIFVGTRKGVLILKEIEVLNNC